MDERFSIIKFENLFGITNINVVRRIIPEGASPRVHWHNYYELGLIVSGKMQQHINGREYCMEPGSIYLMSFYDYHSYTAVKDTELINISFMPDVPDRRMSYFLEQFSRTAICRLDREDMTYIQDRIDRIEREITENKYMSEIMISSLLSETLTVVFRMSDDSTEEVMPLLVRKATGYIHSNFRQVDISLNSIAQELSVSPGHLGKLLKKSVNKSFNEYLGDVRMKYACSLLELSGMSVKEIALAAGYNSSTYFLQVFKKRFGTTPGEYKKNMKMIQEHEC